MSENAIDPSIIGERETCLGMPFNLECCDAKIKLQKKTRKNISEILSKLPHHFNDGSPHDSHPDANLKELKKYAKSYTCGKHGRYAEHFAYFWLASHSLSHFLKRMGWSREPKDWLCLAQEDTDCELLACSINTSFHQQILHLLNKIVLQEAGAGAIASLVPHWLCQRHGHRSLETENRLLQKCEAIWSTMKFTHRPNPRRQFSTPHKNNQLASRTYSTPESINSPVSFVSGNLEQIKSSPESPPLSDKAPKSLTRQTFLASTPKLSSSTERSLLQSTQSNANDTQPSTPLTPPDTPTPKQRTPRALLASRLRHGQFDVSGFDSADFNVTRSPPKDYQTTTACQTDAKYQSYPEQATSVDHRPARASLSDEEDARDDAFFKFVPYSDSKKSFVDIEDDVLKCMRPEATTPYRERGSLYIFALQSHPGFFKIGRTRKTVESRRRKVSKCFPHPLQLQTVWSDKVELPERVESLIFYELDNYRRKFKCRCKTTHDEWFEIEQKDAIAIVERYVKWMDEMPYQLNPSTQLVQRWTLQDHWHIRIEEWKGKDKKCDVEKGGASDLTKPNKTPLEGFFTPTPEEIKALKDEVRKRQLAK
ncbi:MAG: hypothetical protein LQ351_000690 [Letrouitia transgressa]|nr:MAG: hypothetical protein LQ351_000690 [Letrouitia transgressa]